MHGLAHMMERLLTRLVPQPTEKVVNIYNSIDAWESISTVYQEHLLREKPSMPRWLKWTFVLLVPLGVAVISVLMQQILQAINRLQLRHVLNAIDVRFHDNQGIALLCCVGAVCAMTFATLSLGLLVSHRYGDDATGRGLAAVVAHLNGVHLPHWGKWSNVAIKFVTTILIVASNVPLGQFGMMIEIGAMLGAAVLHRDLVSMKVPFLRHFRNPRDRRLIVNIGLAAGVTAVFQSPIGGLLLVLELLTSKFPVKFAAYVFTGCVFCAFCVQVYTTYLAGFRLRDQDGETLRLDPTSEELQIELSYYMIVPSVIIAFICALVGVLWTRLTVLLARINNHRKLTLFTAAAYVAAGMVYASLNVAISLAFGGYQCTPFGSSADAQQWSQGDPFQESASLGVVTALFCHNRTLPADGAFSLSTEYPVNPYASMALVFPESAFRLLIQREVTLHLAAVSVFTVVLFVGSALFGSLTRTLNGDTILPNAALGACLGRIVYQCQIRMFSAPDTSWVNGGEYALIGAAAMVSAVNRLTFSLVFLMVDVSGDVRHVAFIMLGVTVARVIAQNVFHCPSLIQSMLEIASVPHLDFADKIATRDDLTLHLFQTPGLETLRPEETVGRLLDVLTRTSHAAFPVVTRKGKHLIGMIHRNTIELLLWRYTDVPPESLCGDAIEQLAHFEENPPEPSLPSARWHPDALQRRMPGVSLVAPDDKSNALYSVALHSTSARPGIDTNAAEIPNPHADIDEYVILQDLEDWLTAQRLRGYYTPEGSKSRVAFPTLAQAIGDADRELLRLRVNLLRYADKSPFTVRLATSAGRAYHMFNVLGARHIVILDYGGRPRGILTRIDLLRHVFEDKRQKHAFVSQQEEQVPTDSDDVGSPVVPSDPALGDGSASDKKENDSFIKIYPDASRRFMDRAPVHRPKLTMNPSAVADDTDDPTKSFVFVSHKKPAWSGNTFISTRKAPTLATAESSMRRDTVPLIDPQRQDTTNFALRRALFMPAGSVPLAPSASKRERSFSSRGNLSFARPSSTPLKQQGIVPPPRASPPSTTGPPSNPALASLPKSSLREHQDYDPS